MGGFTALGTVTCSGGGTVMRGGGVGGAIGSGGTIDFGTGGFTYSLFELDDVGPDGAWEGLAVGGTVAEEGATFGEGGGGDGLGLCGTGTDGDGAGRDGTD